MNCAHSVLKRLLLMALAALLPAAGLTLSVAPAGAAPTSSISCHASMSNSRPSDYSTTYVNVSTVAHASVTTTAHYKTKNTSHSATANGSGKASVPYRISGATPGFRVVVSVSVHKGGKSGSCSTSFTPHR